MAKFVLGILMVLAVLATGHSWAGPDNDGWYRGAQGYQQAFEEYKRTGQPLLIYFHEPDCGWCQRLDPVMAKPKVRQFLGSYIKVIIQISESPAAASLAEEMNVQGTPDLRVWYADRQCNARVDWCEGEGEDCVESPDYLISQIEGAC